MPRMKRLMQSLVTLASAAAFSAVVSAQHQAMPKGMTHEEHLAKMKKDVDKWNTILDEKFPKK